MTEPREIPTAEEARNSYKKSRDEMIREITEEVVDAIEDGVSNLEATINLTDVIPFRHAVYFQSMLINRGWKVKIESTQREGYLFEITCVEE